MPASDHSPDFFSEGYTKWEMDAQGMLKSKLIADKMIHYSDDGMTQLLKPELVFSRGEQVSWRVNADSGALSDQGKRLELNGRVTIERGDDAQGKALKIVTTDLLVKPKASYAETNDWAEIIKPPNVTTGRGMKLFFAEPIKLQLLADVKGKYEKK